VALYLLDTGILIRHLRGQRATVHLLRGLGGKSRLAVSVVSRTEIRARMLPHEARDTRRLLSRMETVPVDRAIADRAGDLIRRAHGQGHTLHLGDALIAATAARRGLTLITLNTGHFTRLGVSLYPILEHLNDSR
jgi:predicted nucleic acid-binding protein